MLVGKYRVRLLGERTKGAIRFKRGARWIDDRRAGQADEDQLGATAAILLLNLPQPAQQVARVSPGLRRRLS